MLTRIFAVSISTFIFVLSPGIGAYEAAAKTIAAPAANTVGVSAPIGMIPLALTPTGSAGSASSLIAPTLESSLPNIAAFTLPGANSLAVQSVSAQATAPAAAPKNAAVAAAAPVLTAPKTAVKSEGVLVAPKQQTVVGRTLNGVGQALKAVEGVSEAAPGDAHDMGVSLENALSGARTRTGGSSVLPVAGRFSSLRSGLENAADARNARNTRFDAPELVGPAINKIKQLFTGRSMWGTGEFDDGQGRKISLRNVHVSPTGAPQSDRVVIDVGYRWGTSDAWTSFYLTLVDGRSPALLVQEDIEKVPFKSGDRIPREGLVREAALSVSGDAVTIRAEVRGEPATFTLRRAADGSLQWTEEYAEGKVRVDLRGRSQGRASVGTPAGPVNGADAAVDSDAQSRKGHSAPLPARIFATVVAALPAVLLGAPLILGGSIAGYLIAGASVGLMAMPFFGQKTSALLRRAPGIAVAALGAFSAGAAVVALGLGAFSSAPFWMGALAALGGWGLFRFGAQPDKEYFNEVKVITAFFGGLAAVAGVGLVALGPVGVLAAIGGVLPGVAASAWAGFAVTGATWLSYPLAAMLLMHLPGWVGEGIGAAVDGLYQSVRATLRTMLSIHRDTVLRDRLEAWTEKKLELNKWNFWKVAAVWAPLLIVEAGMGLAAIVGGTLLGALQAVPMFLWGASHKLAPKSGVTKYFAAWNRAAFYNAQGSKKKIYNRLAAPLMRAANSESVVKSWSAGALLRALQIAWLGYALLAAPLVHAVAALRAFGKTGEAYDPALHSPRSLKYDRDDSPVEKPVIDKNKPVRDLIPAGLIATALVGLPVYFFGLPLLGAPLIGVPYLVLGAALAVIPMLPSSTPKFVRQLPGWVMAGFGLLTLVAVPYMSFGPSALVSALSSNAFWFGAVTLLSGFGFVSNITKLAKQRDGKVWPTDDPEYIGAFLGALGVLTGAGLAFAGVSGGWLGALMIGSYLSSGLLLMHLPKWFWTGVGTVFQGGMWSAGNFHKFYDFWGEDTKFRKNMQSHARYYLDGSIWKVIGNSTWLSLIWVPTALVWLAEVALSLVTGVLAAALRAPLNWAWGSLYEMDEDAKITRFVAGWARHSNEWVEGEVGRKKIFLGLLDKLGLTAAMNEGVAPSGRPSIKAVLAFAGARVVQLLWLPAFVGVVLPATLLTGIFAGIKNASGVKKKPDPNSGEWYQDADDPDALF